MAGNQFLRAMGKKEQPATGTRLLGEGTKAVPAPLPPPPKFDSKAQASAAYHHIMSRAAEYQKLLNFHVVRSAATTDPARRAEALDSAIRAGEQEMVLFRQARDVLRSVVPTLPLPPPLPQGLLDAAAPSFHKMPSRPIPKPI